MRLRIPLASCLWALSFRPWLQPLHKLSGTFLTPGLEPRATFGDPSSPDLNWVSSGVLSTYSDNSIVTFDDTAAGNTSPIMIAAGEFNRRALSLIIRCSRILSGGASESAAQAR